jgi:hydrogenase nickel incorporation protein HypA/HybF
MHEFGLCESFVDAIERRAAGRQVSGVRVRIGALHRVDEEAFAQAFGFVMTGTVAEGATVEVITTPALLDCPACGVETESDELLPACPSCGGLSMHVAGGNELILESIRLDPVSGDDPRSGDGAAPDLPELGTELEIGEHVPPEPDDGHVHPPPQDGTPDLVQAGG